MYFSLFLYAELVDVSQFVLKKYLYSFYFKNIFSSFLTLFYFQKIL